MTHNEFAELSLAYLLKYTKQLRFNNLHAFVKYLNDQVCPLVADISTETSSYSYLESQSCASIGMGQMDLMNIWKKQYGGILAKGLTVEVLKAHLPDQKKEILEGTTLIVPCLNDITRLQLNAISREVFHDEAGRVNVALASGELDNLWNALVLLRHERSRRGYLWI